MRKNVFDIIALVVGLFAAMPLRAEAVLSPNAEPFAEQLNIVTMATISTAAVVSVVEAMPALGNCLSFAAGLCDRSMSLPVGAGSGDAPQAKMTSHRQLNYEVGWRS